MSKRVSLILNATYEAVIAPTNDAGNQQSSADRTPLSAQSGGCTTMGGFLIRLEALRRSGEHVRSSTSHSSVVVGCSACASFSGRDGTISYPRRHSAAVGSGRGFDQFAFGFGEAHGHGGCSALARL
jgi:hypothetical protein